MHVLCLRAGGDLAHDHVTASLSLEVGCGLSPSNRSAPLTSSTLTLIDQKSIKTTKTSRNAPLPSFRTRTIDQSCTDGYRDRACPFGVSPCFVCGRCVCQVGQSGSRNSSRYKKRRRWPPKAVANRHPLAFPPTHRRRKRPSFEPHVKAHAGGGVWDRQGLRRTSKEVPPTAKPTAKNTEISGK